jgi:hypothetical protein
MKTYAVTEPDRVLAAADLVGGDAMVKLAKFYLYGTVPPNHSSAVAFLEDVSTDLCETDGGRAELIDMVTAAACGGLDEWAIRHTTARGAKKLGALRELDRAKFVATIKAAVTEHGSLAAAAKMLNVSYQTMLRYMKEVRDESNG